MAGIFFLMAKGPSFHPKKPQAIISHIWTKKHVQNIIQLTKEQEHCFNKKFKHTFVKKQGALKNRVLLTNI